MRVTIEMIKALRPCYSDAELAEAMEDGFEAGIRLVPASDARWVLARLLTRENLIVWANASAKRAREYVACGCSVYAAYYASSAASYASSAAHCAAHYATADDATAATASYASSAAHYAAAAAAYYYAERRIAIGHAVAMLEEQEG